MVQQSFLNHLQKSLRNEKEADKQLTHLKTDYEDEKKLAWIAKQIINPTESFDPLDPPYSLIDGKLSHYFVTDLEKLVSMDISPLVQARIYDFLWIKEKDYQYAKKAYCSFAEVIQSNHNNKFEKYCFIINRMFSIFFKLGNKTLNQEILINSIKKLLRLGDKNTNFFFLNLIKILFEKSLLSVDQLITICEKKVTQCNNEHIIISYFDLLEKLYAKKYNVKLSTKPSNNKEIDQLRRQKAIYMIYIANKDYESKQYYQYIFKAKRAIALLKQVRGTEKERLKLFKRLDVVQKKAMKNMHTFEHKTDITKIVNSIEKSLIKLNKEESLCFFAYHIPILRVNELYKMTMEEAKRHPLKQLFPDALLDNNGKLRAIIPPMTNVEIKQNDPVLLANMERKAYMYYQVYGDALVKNTLHLIKSRFEFTMSDIEKIIEGSIFVPHNRKVAYVRGLLAGFNNDYITALSILVPQVENSIRHLAVLCGDVIYNLNEQGYEELKTMNAILELPHLKDDLHPNILFNLKAIFTSKYCYNMRNEVSHGTLNDNEFSSIDTLYVWWFIFNICYTFSWDTLFENNRKIKSKLQERNP
jgi:hypothetical protein